MDHSKGIYYYSFALYPAPYQPGPTNAEFEKQEQAKYNSSFRLTIEKLDPDLDTVKRLLLDVDNPTVLEMLKYTKAQLAIYEDLTKEKPTYDMPLISYKIHRIKPIIELLELHAYSGI